MPDYHVHIDGTWRKMLQAKDSRTAAEITMLDTKTDTASLITVYEMMVAGTDVTKYHLTSIQDNELKFEYTTKQIWADIRVEYCIHITIDPSNASSYSFYSLLLSDEIGAYAIRPLKNGNELYIYFLNESDAQHAKSKIDYYSYSTVSEIYSVLVYMER